MNVLSLFDGMSCGRIALREAGLPVDNYFACEIDRHAVAQTTLNFPDTVHLGDVRDLDTDKLPRIDLLLGGSPCTDFSMAGRRRGMSTETREDVTTLGQYLRLKADGFEFAGQSFLFWEYMRVLCSLQAKNPAVRFLLENVEMGRKWESVITEAVGIAPVHINSALVSAQNRKRVYWTNIRTRRSGLFGEEEADIPQPRDRGLVLRDILQPEDEVDGKYYLSDAAIQGLLGHLTRNREKGNGFGCDIRTCGQKSQTVRVKGTGVYDLVAPRFTGVSVTARGLRPYMGGDKRGLSEYGTLAFDTSKGDTLTNRWHPKVIRRLSPVKGKDGRPVPQGKRCYDAGGKSPAHFAQLPNGAYLVDDTEDPCFRIRRLTPTECARLQTIPQWYRWECSDTQQYRMLGNGWTVEVIKHILSFLPETASAGD